MPEALLISYFIKVSCDNYLCAAIVTGEIVKY